MSITLKGILGKSFLMKIVYHHLYVEEHLLTSFP